MTRKMAGWTGMNECPQPVQKRAFNLLARPQAGQALVGGGDGFGAGAAAGFA
jgi:hypothetical protein